MARYLLRRAGVMLFTLWAVTTVTFFLFRAVPGDPSVVLIGPDMGASDVAALSERFGVGEPVLVQYGKYLLNVATGDLGVSFRYGIPVTEVLGEKLANTLVLVLPAMLFALAAGLLLGSTAAARWRRPTDRGITQFFLTVKSAPSFWLATLVLMLFSYRLGWAPTGGMATPGLAPADGLARFVSGDFLSHLILPLAVLSLVFTVEPLLTTRTAMVDNLGKDYVELAVAKGVKPSRIWLQHAARNSLLPVISLLPAIAGHLVGGQVIIETVFSWPGMGREIVEAVNRLDYPVMQGAFLATAVLIILINAVSDIAYTYLDPRVRLS